MTRKTHAPRRRGARIAALWMIVLGVVCALGLAFASAATAEETTSEEPKAGIPIYRLYNRWDGQHLFTPSASEVATLLAYGWKDEGVAFRAYSTSEKPADVDVVAVHRLYNRSNSDHFLSKSESEVANLASHGWTDEGTVFYAPTSGTPYAVYRTFNSYMRANGGRGSHMWTISKGEYDTNVKAGCTGEGIQWYAIGPAEAPEPTTPVDIHGALSVRGTNIVDKHGANFQLRGMSTHGIAWFPQYVTYSGFQTLRDDWGANCVRLAMYTAEYNGYCTGGDQNWLKGLVRQGVDAATELGMYVIVDWHVMNADGSPTTYEQQARAFFDEMSREFKDHSNVLYEICNEPCNGTSWSTIKGYAERIIPVIRANDPDALVIVGTPDWSQGVDQAAARRITGPSGQNTLYALHFYAGTHGQWLIDRMNAALDAGLPIFISEFGTCTADGQWGFYPSEAQRWISAANSRNVSWMNWSLCNKAEAASAIQSWCGKTSGWQIWELTDSGNWVRNQMRTAAGL